MLLIKSSPAICTCCLSCPRPITTKTTTNATTTLLTRLYSAAATHAETPRWPKSPHPTPYQVLDIQRGDAYSKRRFYQLVKLYHPDVADTSTTALPTATRLERYRLVVAAHDLLSDPHKRSLYDHHGIGWIGTSSPSSSSSSSSSSTAMRAADRAWRHQPGNASRNATWEDWERWRARDKPSEPMYMSNGTFAALVVCMCMMGALAQMTRAEAAGEQYVDFVQQKDWAIGQKMREDTLAASGRTKDQRVEGFLRERENLNFDFHPAKLDSGTTTTPPPPPPSR